MISAMKRARSASSALVHAFHHVTIDRIAKLTVFAEHRLEHHQAIFDHPQFAREHQRELRRAIVADRRIVRSQIDHAGFLP